MKNKMHVCGYAFILEIVMFNFRTICLYMWWIFLLLNLHPKSIYLVFVWNQIINHYTTSGSRKGTANAYNERKLCYIVGRQ